MRRAGQLLALTVCLLALTVFGQSAHAKGGMIFGVDLGGAFVSGDQNMKFNPNPDINLDACQNSSGITEKACKDALRTDAGSGFAFGFRLGYNFWGYAALETYVHANLNTESGGGKFEGSAGWGFLGKYFPLEHFAKLKQRWYDPFVYFGGGFITYAGYHEEYRSDHELRGWNGGHLLFGLGSDFYVHKTVSLGLDLRFMMPMYKTFIYDWDKDITATPASTPSTFIFAPMATVTFHFLDPTDF